MRFEILNNLKGKIESQLITNSMGRYIGSKLVEINNNSVESFEKERPNIPKCILFTEKKGNPLIFKALSVAFDKKIDMGIVRSSETGITSKYRIKKFPSILVLQVDKKQRIYEGAINYKELFDFLNIFSETFFRVGEETPRLSDPNKPDTKAWKKEVNYSNLFRNCLNLIKIQQMIFALKSTVLYVLF